MTIHRYVPSFGEGHLRFREHPKVTLSQMYQPYEKKLKFSRGRRRKHLVYIRGSWMKRKLVTNHQQQEGARGNPRLHALFPLFLTRGVSFRRLSPFLTTEDQLRILCICSETARTYPQHVQHLENVKFAHAEDFPHLERLQISSSYNGVIHLPPNLQSLITGPKFNKPLRLFNPLHTLILGSSFTQYLEFPSGLRVLHVGKKYKHPIVFPEGLEEFQLDNASYSHPLRLPPTIRRFTSNVRLYKGRYQLPEGLVYLSLDHGGSQLQLPSTLKYFRIQKLAHPVQLPNSLEELYCVNACLFTGDVGDLPIGLKRFVYHGNWKRELPSTVTDLLIGSLSDTTRLPDSLITLTMSNIKFPITFPQNLNFLEVHSSDVPLTLPPKLHIFIVGSSFQQAVERNTELQSIKRQACGRNLISIPKDHWHDLGAQYIRTRGHG